MNIHPPKKISDGKFEIEISYYPESRSVETHTFDNYEEAYAFYKQNRRKLKLVTD